MTARFCLFQEESGHRDCEKMSKCVGAGDSPPCITARRGGCVINKNIAKLPKQTQPGWFSSLFLIGKPPRPRGQRRLRIYFLIARPPLLAVMQGGESASPKHFDIFSQPHGPRLLASSNAQLERTQQPRNGTERCQPLTLLKPFKRGIDKRGESDRRQGREFCQARIKSQCNRCQWGITRDLQGTGYIWSCWKHRFFKSKRRCMVTRT